MLDGDAVAASQQWVYLRQALLQLVLLVAVAVSKEGRDYLRQALAA